MSYFLRNGNTFRISSEASLDLHSELPAGNYVIKEDQFGNLYLEQIDSFKPLKKYYGNTLRNTDRILNTFMDRDSATGVMLTGEKGSGKSLLAKNLSITAALTGIPTIVINYPWVGDKFNSLIQSIEQPCIVLFDEFEKVYDAKLQEHVLTLLDGVFPSKTLFVLTCNDKWRIDSHMRNRPGRIFYMIEYKGLSEEFVREYAEDNLKDKSQIEALCQIANLFSEFNFDMLKAIVEDMNRYDEPATSVLDIINAKPEYESSVNNFDVTLIVEGVEVKLDRDTWRGNPISIGQIHLYKNEDQDDATQAELIFTFKNTDIVKIDDGGNRFVLTNEEKETLILKKKVDAKFDVRSLVF